MNFENLLQTSAVHQAQLVHSREITAVELIKAYIQRIENVHVHIRAYVAFRFDEAIEEAKKIDSRSDKPFWAGVPCSIKECFALSGMPQTAGLVSRKGFIAIDDAHAVSAYRNAGAIPLGVTNTSELCMWMESRNVLYGQTNNPYDSLRIAGGSSGGEAAAVSAACSAFGLGSDIGGSIRMPAFFCGVFGHKPSSRLVSNTGQYPNAFGIAQNYLSTGPISHHAEDLLPLLQTLAPQAHFSSQSLNLSEIRILNIPGNGIRKPTDELRIAQERVLSFCQQQGAEILTINPPALKNSIQIWSAMLEHAGGDTFEDLLFPHDAPSLLFELFLNAKRSSQHTLPALLLIALERLSKMLPNEVNYWVREGNELKRIIDSLLDHRTIALFPSYPRTAPRHRYPMLTPLDFAYTAIGNILEIPITQVPLGLGAKGLPLGLQVLAGHGRDDISIAFALLMEKEFGGWVPPKFEIP